MMAATLHAFRAHAAVEAPREACGLVLRAKGAECFWPGRNLAVDDDHFVLSPDDLAEAEDFGQVMAVCHSHPDAPSTPSGADLAACAASRRPWYILGSDGLQRIDPKPVPLESRVFDYGHRDCWSLVRDWFLEHRGVRLLDFARTEKFWERGESPYTENAVAWGFREIQRNEIEEGDVLLMRVKSRVPNHAAIYLGGERILHHMWGQLSREEPLHRFQPIVTHAWRLCDH